MFGFEFSTKKGILSFPRYNVYDAISPDSIEHMTPLVWQEHCVECGMPECYQTCCHYKPRIDGRCKLFEHGIVRFKNSRAILGQTASVQMREWGKLQTFSFTASLPYSWAKRLNCVYVFLAELAILAKNGRIRRLCYYIKEYISRKIGFIQQKESTPKYFLMELINDGPEYSVALESLSNNQLVFRRTFAIKKGYNRFIVPTKELYLTGNKQSVLCLYSADRKEITMHIVSLAIVDFKPEYQNLYVKPNTKKVKLVAWDLDNTLWDGILSEDGSSGIRLNLKIMEVIKELDRKGIINSIVSKNDEEKVLPVLQELGIDSYFVMPMINWHPKSQNIKALAKGIDLSLDTFVFVDDTPNELQEVSHNCPEVRICPVEKIAEFVKGEIFDVPVTEESRNRRQMYQELSVRNRRALQFENNIDDFLRDCQMIMHILPPQEIEVERCFELLQRTNQLNISAERLSKEELETLLLSPVYDCYRIKVNDRYGDYGLVGFAVFNTASKETVVLEHFVFSCRAARKKLEQSFFETIIAIYRKKGYVSLKLNCKKTERNALMQSVLEESGLFEKEEESESGFTLTAALDREYPQLNIAEIVLD